MGLAKIVVDATCHFKREPKYFPSPSFRFALIFELPSIYLSPVIFIPLCAYLSRTYLDLPLLLFCGHLRPSPPNPLQVNSPFVFMVCFFLLSFCLFLFIPLPFLDPVLSVPPQLLTLSGSVYKLQIPYPALSGHSYRIFPMCLWLPFASVF